MKRVLVAAASASLLSTTFMSGISLLPSVPWVDVDLIVPKSFKPFSPANETYVGVESIWSTSHVVLKNHIHEEIEKVFAIDSFDEGGAIASAFNVNPAVVLLLDDLKKYSKVFRLTAIGAVGLSWVSIMILVMLLSDGGGSSCGVRRVGRSKYYIHRPPSPLRTLIPYCISFVAATVACIVGVVYAYTVIIDSRALLPSLVHRLKILCLTHGKDTCRLQQRVRIGAVVFIAATLLQITASLALTLASYIQQEEDLDDLFFNRLIDDHELEPQ